MYVSMTQSLNSLSELIKNPNQIDFIGVDLI